jgi:hypothetical protein
VSLTQYCKHVLTRGVPGSSGEESNARQAEGGRRDVSTRDAYRQLWQWSRNRRRQHVTVGVPDVDAVQAVSAGVETRQWCWMFSSDSSTLRSAALYVNVRTLQVTSLCQLLKVSPANLEITAISSQKQLCDQTMGQMVTYHRIQLLKSRRHVLFRNGPGGERAGGWFDSRRAGSCADDDCRAR